MLDKEIERIKKKKPKKIALQFPEGLKKDALKLARKLESKTRAGVIVLADSCFGACDLRDYQAKGLGCDLIVHFGHSELDFKPRVRTIYIESKSKLDVKPAVRKAGNELQEEKIGVVTTIQHIDSLEEVKRILKRFKKKVYIGRSGKRAKHMGQILGCDFSAAKNIESKVECFLYIGTGEFHPIGLSLITEKPVYIADPERNEFRRIEYKKDKLLRQRFAKIERAKQAKSFGILLSTKRGQKREKTAKSLKKLLERKNKKAVILAMDTINPDSLQGFRLDCYVNTACPRIAIDDSALYDKPILTPPELEIALGVRKWVEYEVDGI